MILPNLFHHNIFWHNAKHQKRNSEKRMTKTYDCAITHGGRFHADDVFSAALLKMVYPDIRIIRTFTVPDDFEGIVFDIGGGKYDHHQKDSDIRDNGIPYAAFGLLWREFGEQIIAKECPPDLVLKETARFDERFIQQLDEDDNTGCGNQMAGVIGTFNPCWDSEVSSDACFAEATAFAGVILQKRIDSVMSINRAKILVETALIHSRDHIVILPRFAPWKMTLQSSQSLFVIYPSQRGGYSAQAIPSEFDPKELRCAFPEAWAGISTEELPLISGVKTLTFCHKSCFLISTGLLEDAILACKIAMKTENKLPAAFRDASPVSSNKSIRKDAFEGFRTGIRIELKTDEV